MRAKLRRIGSLSKNTVLVPKADLRLIRSSLHPDRARTPAERDQAEAASKAFNAMNIEAV